MSWDNSKTLASNEEKQCEHRFKACLDAQVIYMKPHSVVYILTWKFGESYISGM